MVDKLPDLIDAGIASLKVEGRMKTNLYVAVCARTYREAIDDYFESEELYNSKIPHYLDEISACTMRDFTRGFYYGKPSEEDQIYDNNTYIRNAVYMGLVEEVTEDGYVVLYQKNKFSVGDELEVMNFDGTNSVCMVSEIINQYGESVDSAPHPKEKLKVKLDIDGNVKPEPGVIIRQK